MAGKPSDRISRAARARRRMAAPFLAVALGAAATSLGASPATSGEPVEDLTIAAVHSGKVMDVRLASHDPGAEIIQWAPHGGENQDWAVVELAEVNGIPWVLIGNLESGLVLDVDGGSTGAGTRITQDDWNGDLSQWWLIVPFGDTGLGIIVNANSGMVADVAGAAVANGARIIQWPWHGGANQVWFVPTPIPLDTPTSSSTTVGPTGTSMP